MITSCVSSTPAPEKSGDASWQMLARVGIKTANETSSFGLNWRQSEDSFDLRLSGALGIQVAHIYGDESQVAIDIPKQGTFKADNASDLLTQHTGLVLPIESLRYWVRGGPAPNIPFEFNEKNLLQSGWQISYIKYDGEDPVKMRLTRPELNILLVVKSWR